MVVADRLDETLDAEVAVRFIVGVSTENERIPSSGRSGFGLEMVEERPMRICVVVLEVVERS